MPGDLPPVLHDVDRFGVVREVRAARDRRRRQTRASAGRPRPSGSRTTARRRSGRPVECRETARSVAAFDTSRGAGRCSSGSTPVVALPSQPRVELERGAERQPVLRRPSDRCRRGRAADAGTTARCAPARAARGSIRARDRRRPDPQRPQAAVRGLLMVERGAAAEIGRLDERHAQPAARRVVRAGEPVDAAADDEHVVNAGRRVASGRAVASHRRHAELYLIVGAVSSPAAASTDDVRDYWNRHIHDLEITTHPVGSPRVLRRSRSVPFREAAPPAAAGRLRRLLAASGCSRSAAARAPTWPGLRKGGAIVTGVDLSSSAIALAQAELRAAGAAGAICARPTASTCRLPTTRSILVYAHGVVQYTARSAALVDECRRVLKPGGEAVFQVYNRISWLNALSKLMKVPLEHEDAPVLLKYSAGEFRAAARGLSRRADRRRAVSR